MNDKTTLNEQLQAEIAERRRVEDNLRKSLELAEECDCPSGCRFVF